MNFEMFVNSYESINPEVFGIRISLFIMIIIGVIVIATMALNVTSGKLVGPAIIVFSGITIMTGLFFYDSYSRYKKDEIVVNYAHGLESKKADVMTVVKKNSGRDKSLLGDNGKNDVFIVTSNIDGKSETASVAKKYVNVIYDLSKEEKPYMKYSVLDINMQQFSKLSTYNGIYVKEIHLVEGTVIKELKVN